MKLKSGIYNIYCGTIEEAIKEKARLQSKGYEIVGLDVGMSAPGSWIKITYEVKEEG